MQPLAGKTAIVTGGGSGIGRGIVLALANEGVRVAACGRRLHKLEETVGLALQAGGQAIAIQADISDLAQVEKLVITVTQEFGKVDILVNNAGIAEGSSLHETSPEVWDAVMNANLRGVYLLTRQVLPAMRSRRSGHIINISSESGIEYYRGDSIYGTSKHALNALGEFIQRENQEFNIRVNTICPGMVVSEMTETEPGLNHARCLYPEDIADLAIWLLTRRENIKIGTPILIQTMLNPWE